jgi:hypothetical protein
MSQKWMPESRSGHLQALGSGEMSGCTPMMTVSGGEYMFHEVTKKPMSTIKGGRLN